MTTPQATRLLSIGEFAAATQLSPKALRLYDEQHILRPASVDTANGYRYYSASQIAQGRLIRSMRDMDLSLTEIANAVREDAKQAEALLRQFAAEQEQRHVLQRRALHAALEMLKQAEPPTAAITQWMRPAVTALLRPFTTDRQHLAESFGAEVAAGLSVLRQHGIAALGAPFCVLLNPLSGDEALLEAAIPIEAPRSIPGGVALRQLAEVSCVVLRTQASDAGAIDLPAQLDTLFDWLDRHGHRAIEPPTLALAAEATGVRIEIQWAFEAAPVSPDPARQS